ncbi:hypothetical protein OIU74_027813 [Salix koriyanagi]|uniref:Uncharacterized protein n=1 Tax=Salix koriyanagi TaxID=2511006 RepID=A0A9Q0VRJ5_9ROSI|nr:hypothetical protein OIU74_027813 [Salix koriyanagi]
MRSLSLSALTLSSLLLLLLLLLNTKRCRASISLPEMDGDLPLYSIADSNLDSEFMMDSEINRILVGSVPVNIYKTKDSGNPLFQCGRGQRYCVAQDNKNRCVPYKRDCNH